MEPKYEDPLLALGASLLSNDLGKHLEETYILLKVVVVARLSVLEELVKR